LNGIYLHKIETVFSVSTIVLYLSGVADTRPFSLRLNCS